MADLAVTPANVVASLNGQRVLSKSAGEAISAGDVVYFDSTAGLMKKSDANGVAATQAVDGIALSTAALNQPLAYVQTDPALVPGFAVTAGTVYVLSATPGKVAPIGDLASGMKAVVLGIGNADGTLNFSPLAGGALA